MPKKILQDVIPSEKKSIRSVPVSKSKAKAYKDLPENKKVDVKPEIKDGYFSEIGKKNRFSWKYLGWLLLIIILGVSLYVVFGISGATVKIYLKKATSQIDGTYVAKKVPQDGNVSYETISITKQGSKVVEATDEQEVQKKASGMIIVYNDYSSQSQKLIKNTRFESASGLIYRTNSSIVVPGKKIVDGKSVPGSVEAMVYADSPGAEYNSKLTDFTIPGFKGDPRYSKFYARSKTEIQGGFSGKLKVVSEQTTKDNQDSLKKELQDQLVKEISVQKPNGYVFYDKAYKISYSDLPSESSGNSVIIKESAIITGVIFKESILSEFLALKSGLDISSGGIIIKNINDLSLSLKDVSKLDSSDLTQIDFTIKGIANFVWDVDEKQLSMALVSVNKQLANSVFKAFPNIDKVEVSMMPIWKSKFPSKAEDIKIIKII